MSAYRITTATLPAPVREQYEIVGHIPGGPVIALPHYGFGQVDFSRLTEQDAARLIQAGFPHLRRRTVRKKNEPPGEEE